MRQAGQGEHVTQSHDNLNLSVCLFLLTSQHRPCGAGFSASPLGSAFPPHLTPTEGPDVMLSTSSRQFPAQGLRKSACLH